MERLHNVINIPAVSWKEINRQFSKDLNMSGIDHEAFLKVETPEAFLTLFKSLIMDLISYHSEDFNKLMYRIDVPEREMVKIIETSFDQVVEQTCYLILKREAQKVIFRKQFK